MELKKSEKADLESKKNMFLMVGLVIALAVSLLAFEWTARPRQAASLGTLNVAAVEEEVIPITRQEEIKTPPPPPPVTVVEVLNIVDNTAKVNDDLSVFDSEADKETLIDVAPIVAAKEEKEEEETQVFYIVEEMPQFPGGDDALLVYLSKSINYPVIAQENGIQGKVYVQFIVDRDGSITDAKVSRSVDPSLDKEALRVVNSLPKWKPGKQRGRPVRVSYTVPIAFVLN